MGCRGGLQGWVYAGKDRCEGTEAVGDVKELGGEVWVNVRGWRGKAAGLRVWRGWGRRCPVAPLVQHRVVCCIHQVQLIKESEYIIKFVVTGSIPTAA